MPTTKDARTALAEKGIELTPEQLDAEREKILAVCNAHMRLRGGREFKTYWDMIEFLRRG